MAERLCNTTPPPFSELEQQAAALEEENEHGSTDDEYESAGEDSAVSEAADMHPCSSSSASQLPPSALPQLLEQTRNLSEEKYFELIQELTTDLPETYEPNPSYEERLEKCYKVLQNHYFNCSLERLERENAKKERERRNIQEGNHNAVLQDVFHMDVESIEDIAKPALLQHVNEGNFIPQERI